MINYNELLPVFLIGFACSIIANLDLFKRQFSDTEGKANLRLFAVEFVRNFIFTTIFAVFLFYLCGSFTENYQLKLGIVGVISILGIEKALELVEKIMNLRR